MKKTTHWNDSVNMFGLFVEDKEEVNSLSESLAERVFIDTCASLGIFLLSRNGESYLQRVEVLSEPISLGLTDINSQMLVHRMGSYNDWHNIMVCDTTRKSIIAADKIAARGYTIVIGSEVKILRGNTHIMTCAKENGMPWVYLKDLLELLNAPEQDLGPVNLEPLIVGARFSINLLTNSSRASRQASDFESQRSAHDFNSARRDEALPYRPTDRHGHRDPRRDGAHSSYEKFNDKIDEEEEERSRSEYSCTQTCSILTSKSTSAILSILLRR
jgi:hypothetical protein